MKVEIKQRHTCLPVGIGRIKVCPVVPSFPINCFSFKVEFSAQDRLRPDWARPPGAAPSSARTRAVPTPSAHALVEILVIGESP